MKFLLPLLIFSIAYFVHNQSININQSFANNNVLISHIDLRVYKMNNGIIDYVFGRMHIYV